MSHTEIPKVCYHCGQEIDPNHSFSSIIKGQELEFCCQGCLSACLIIHEAGEEAYYKNRTAPAPNFFSGLSIPGESDELFAAPESRSRMNKAYDLPGVTEEYTSPVPGKEGLLRLNLSLQGIHCSSCVFLNERLLNKTKGINSASVNYDTGRAEIEYNPDIIKISSIIQIIQSIGYDARPVRPGQKSDAIKNEGKDLLWKMAVAGFLAGNIMMIAMGDWFGYFSNTMDERFRRFFHWMEFILATPAYIYTGSVFHRGWKSFFKTFMPGMDLLISAGLSAAYFYSVYVVLSGKGEIYFDSVATIIFFLLIGRYFEWLAKYNQRMRMEELIRPLPAHCSRLKPDWVSRTAELYQESLKPASSSEHFLPEADMHPFEEVIPLKDLRKGDHITAYPGTVLAADGILETELCEADESVLTGETLPVIRKKGDRLLAGSRIVSGFAVCRVDSLPQESSLSVLGRLADMAGMAKSAIERTTLNVTPYSAAAVLLIAAGTFAGWFFIGHQTFEFAIVATIAVLIISCPCALALAVPTAMSSGLYLGLTNGILVRDGGVFENLAKIKNFYFDKTGTLTRGRPEVEAVWVCEEYFSKKSELLKLIILLEHGSPHPVGKSLLEYSRTGLHLTKIPYSYTQDVIIKEIPGQGMEMDLNENHSLSESLRDDSVSEFLKGSLIRIGNLQYAGNGDSETDIPGTVSNTAGDTETVTIGEFLNSNQDGTVAVLQVSGVTAAVFVLRDSADSASAAMIRELKNQGAEVFMLTGDNRGSALRIASQMGIPEDHVHAGLLPHQKEEFIKNEEEKGNRVCMVGDGFNDAIALSRASVSVAMARGAPLSLEHAGIILLKNDLRGLIRAVKLSRKTLRTIYLNLAISLLYNGIMIPVAATGLLLPVWCALFMSMSSLTVVGISLNLRMQGLEKES